MPDPWKVEYLGSEGGKGGSVLPVIQNDAVNKFDSVSVEAMLALDAAMAEHPNPEDDPLQIFSVWADPSVMVEGRGCRAIACTRSYGLIRMTDADGRIALEWHLAAHIKRVTTTT